MMISAYGIVIRTGAEQLLPAALPLKTIVFLYVGPEQMLPLTSALAALTGLLLMFWHRFVAWVRKAWRFCLVKLQGAVRPRA